MNYHQQRRRLLQSAIAIIALVALLVTGVTIWLLYNTALERQREQLDDMARALAATFEAIALFDIRYSPFYGREAREATLSQVIEAHRAYQGFGRTGEMIVAEKRGDAVSRIFSPRHPRTMPESHVGIPMLRALSGEVGTMVATDYRGERVLAAYRPVPLLRVGIVAKIDMAEIRAPFVRAGAIAAAIALVSVLFGGVLVHRFIFPLFIKVEEGERRYRTLFELSPFAIVVIDPETGEVVDFNRAAYLPYGYSPAELRGMSIPDLDCRHDMAAFRSRVAEIAKEGATTFTTQMRSRGGEIRDTSITARLVELSGRQLLYAVAQDITDQLAAARELDSHRRELERLVEERTGELQAANAQLQQEIEERRRAERELQMAGIVYDNTSEGIFVTDLDGTILSVNPAFTAITGYRKEEAVGRNPRMLESGRQGKEFYQGMWSCLMKEGQWQGELWNRRKNGEEYLQRLTISGFRDEHQRLRNFVAVFRDITQLHRQQEQIRYQAYHDPLTGLPNRSLFQDRLNQALVRARRHGSIGAVLFLDLDRFKAINDTLGHEVGDALLQAVGERLAGYLRQGDTISRFGGDEFVVLVNDLKGPESAEPVAKGLLGACAAPFKVGRYDLAVTTSIGISLFPNDGLDGAELVRYADAAMYEAKKRGSNNYRFHNPALSAQALERMALENDLRRAVGAGELEVFYQPVVQLDNGRIEGVEALLRWHRPGFGMVEPEQFIGVAEETGLVSGIGQWVLETACTQVKAWREAGHDLRVSVNISAHQFSQDDLVASVHEVLEQTGLPGEYLELELTETLMMQQAESTASTLQELKREGISIAVDDFGSGYSCLNYLTRFPVDVLKIDRSFVADTPDDEDDAAIVQTIILLGHSLRLQVVAEGVETDAQRDFLRARGCDMGQGFRLGMPLPARGLEQMLSGGVLQR